MKNITVKISAVALAASLTLSIVACSKKGSGKDSRTETRSGEKISSDTPWFESKAYDVDLGLDTSKKAEYTTTSFVGADSSYLVLMTSGNYKMPENIDWENINYNDYAIYNLVTVDRSSCKTVCSIDLVKGLGNNDFVDNVRYMNGKLTVRYCTCDDVTYEMKYFEKDYDPLTGSISGSRDLEDVSQGTEGSFTIGDYRIDASMNWGEGDNDYYYNLYVTTPDGVTKEAEIKETGKGIWNIPAIFPLTDKTALVAASADGNEALYFELDLENVKTAKLDSKEYEWLNLSDVNSCYNSSDGNSYFKTATGVSKIDLKKKTVEEFFNFTWCDVNRSILSYLEIAECSDDTILLCGSDYTYSAFSSGEFDFVLIEFNKAATNPHAGKTILEMYVSYGYTDAKVADAIMNFNNTNSEYFIEVSDRYSAIGEGDYSEVNSDDEMEAVAYNEAKELSSALAMDIMNGEGPDILINVSGFGQLNSTNYLADLTPYVSDLDPEKYFTNVIECSKVDGKLFNLPITFGIGGIHTDAGYAGASGVGFTIAEYEKFLNGTLNGKDVITSGQAMYFAKLFTNMSDKFISNGKADFSGPEFAELAEFVKNNVSESSRSWDEPDAEYANVVAVGAAIAKGDYYYDENAEAKSAELYGIGNYFYEVAQLKGYTSILGLPSCDGRGPSLMPNFSVAVSAQAQNIDACGEFVKSLLNDSIQNQFAEYDYFVLSKDAFRHAGQLAIAYYNSEESGMSEMIDGSARKQITFSEKHIGELEDIIASCSRMQSADAEINIILTEEMPAYFSGQKELASVIAIAQDRVQKVLDERG